jgi:hypothetical protein
MLFDHVCVTPLEQAQVANDNSQAATRVDLSGAYGPQSCVSGFVWREAFGGDFVCVTSAERDQAATDNILALIHLVAF